MAEAKRVTYDNRGRMIQAADCDKDVKARHKVKTTNGTFEHWIDEDGGVHMVNTTYKSFTVKK